MMINFFQLIFAEAVPVPELLNSVYGQMEKLLTSFKLEDLNKKRKKRESSQEMDCGTFMNLLSLYDELKPLIATPQSIQQNQERIQKLANDMQMYSTFKGVSTKSCDQINQTLLKEKVQSTKSSLGTDTTYFLSKYAINVKSY